MNPAFGRGLERARRAGQRSRALMQVAIAHGDPNAPPNIEDISSAPLTADPAFLPVSGPAAAEPQHQIADGHWVTIDHRHVFIRIDQPPRYDNPRNEAEARLANVIYNETAGLRPDLNAKPGAPGSAEDLHNARVGIGKVAHRVLLSSHPERIQAPTELSAEAVHDINAGNSGAILAHNDSLSAARVSLSSASSGATQYRINAWDDQNTINGRRISERYGPFLNVQGGTRVVIIAP